MRMSEAVGDSRGVSRREWLALAPVLTVTFLGTVNNNIVNVPMSKILADFDVPVGQGALVVIAWALSIAVLLPLMGWLGDRIGRRRLFVISVGLLSLAAFGAALSPNLPTLVAFRALQGAASAAVLPTVMGLIGDITPHRARALSWWAMANGLGQAIGAPLGGSLAAWLGWRSIFWPMGLLGLVALVASLKLVPSTPGRQIPLEWKGASTLTLGVGLLLGSVAVLPQLGIASPAVWSLAAAGLVTLTLFVGFVRHADAPFVPPSLLANVMFVRSNLGVFSQMFCLGATMLAIPLYLTGPGGVSTGRAGLLVFALPAAMALLAPVSGTVTQRLMPLRTLRGGLLLVVLAQCLLAGMMHTTADHGLGLVAVLVLMGVGIAFVQTPAATLATAAVGRVGAGLGLYNLIRFSGSMLGAAWVAVVLDEHGSYATVFVVCASLAGLGLAGTFLGRAPARDVVAPSPVGADAAATA
jgi:MFS family permease